MSTVAGSATRAEIMSQPAAWTAVLKEALAAHSARLSDLLEGVDEILLTGSGSSYNIASMAAPAIIEVAGRRARALLSPDLFGHPESLLLEGSRCGVIAISRSGETTETVRALEEANRRGYPTASLTVCEGSTLGRTADLAIPLPVLGEKSVTATRSVTGTLLFLTGWAVDAAHAAARLDVVDRAIRLRERLERLPSLCGALMPGWDQAASRVAAAVVALGGARRPVFVGGGTLAVTAREAALKALEMSGLPTTWHPLLDYRHGPQSMAGQDLLVALTHSEAADEHDLVREMAARGVPVWAITDAASQELASSASWLTEVGTELGPVERPIAYLPVLQLFAFHAAGLAGRDPDRPPHLTRWVSLEGSGRES